MIIISKNSNAQISLCVVVVPQLVKLVASELSNVLSTERVGSSLQTCFYAYRIL